jgi:hypothetical protein
MLNVLVLAIGAAISPTILAVVIVVLRRPHPRRLLAAYLFGGLLTSIAVGVAVVTSLNGIDFSEAGPAPGPIVDLTVGALSLVVAFVLATDRDARLADRRRERRVARPARDPWSERVLSHGRAPIAFVVGMVLNLPGAMYLVALKDIAEFEGGFGGQLLAILVFNLVMFALAEVPLLGYSFAPEKTQERVERLNAWMSGHARQIVIAVAAAIGLYLIARGLVAVL